MSSKPRRRKMPFDEATAIVAKMTYGEVKAVLRSHGVELWLDHESIVRQLLAEKMERGQVFNPMRTDDTKVVEK